MVVIAYLKGCSSLIEFKLLYFWIAGQVNALTKFYSKYACTAKGINVPAREFPGGEMQLDRCQDESKWRKSTLRKSWSGGSFCWTKNQWKISGEQHFKNDPFWTKNVFPCGCDEIPEMALLCAVTVCSCLLGRLLCLCSTKGIAYLGGCLPQLLFGSICMFPIIRSGPLDQKGAAGVFRRKISIETTICTMAWSWGSEFSVDMFIY